MTRRTLCARRDDVADRASSAGSPGPTSSCGPASASNGSMRARTSMIRAGGSALVREPAMCDRWTARRRFESPGRVEHDRADEPHEDETARSAEQGTADVVDRAQQTEAQHLAERAPAGDGEPLADSRADDAPRERRRAADRRRHRRGGCAGRSLPRRRRRAARPPSEQAPTTSPRRKPANAARPMTTTAPMSSSVTRASLRTAPASAPRRPRYTCRPAGA